MDNHVYISFRFNHTNSTNFKRLLKYFIVFVFVGALVYFGYYLFKNSSIGIHISVSNNIGSTISSETETNPIAESSTDYFESTTTPILTTPESTTVSTSISTQTASQNTTVSSNSTTNDIWNPI